jgi:hypothetical protein
MLDDSNKTNYRQAEERKLLVVMKKECPPQRKMMPQETDKIQKLCMKFMSVKRYKYTSIQTIRAGIDESV